MNCIIPFTKDIKFKTNICEILSISLEHEYTVNDSEILGNFIVSGDYKSHEVSINKEHFEHVLPFSVNIATRIDRESVDFSIEDFTYEIIDKDTLKVNIEYSINATEIKEDEPIFERVEEEEVPFEEMLDEIDDAITNERKDNVIDAESKEEVAEIPVVEVEEEVQEDGEKRDTENEITEEDKSELIESINDKEESFVTYQIHIMKETDTIESVCTKYNTTQTILGDYNDLSTLTIGDKLIIPDTNE